MAIIKTIANKKSSDSSNASTGKKGNQILFGTPLHLIRLKRGTIIPKTTDINLAYFQGLVQTGVAIPLMGATSFERLSAENGLSTTSGGIETLNLKGLTKYKLMFQEGHEFYRQMSRLTAYKQSDYILGDDEGNIKIAVNSNGDYVGFTAGQEIAEGTMEKVQGGDPESKAFTVQFLNTKQFDLNYAVITSAELGFDLNEYEGANPVNLSFSAVPANLETTLVMKAVLAADNDTFVEGTAITNYRVLVDGVPNTVTGVADDVANKTVTLTVTAVTTGAVVTVEFWDATAVKPIIILSEVIYSSEQVSETVVV